MGLYAALFVGSAAPAAEALSRRSFFDAQIGLIKAQPELTVVEKQMVVNSLIALRAQYGVEPRPVG